MSAESDPIIPTKDGQDYLVKAVCPYCGGTGEYWTEVKDDLCPDSSVGDFVPCVCQGRNR
jgi:hypothetical protein